MRLHLFLGLFLAGCPFIREADWDKAADRDHDGFRAAEAGGDDCDDKNAAINPLGIESCDGTDNDCDGEIDGPGSENVRTWYKDLDQDGYGDPGQVEIACDTPADAADNAEDCDDSAATVHPGATEACDGIDQDCDGVADNGASGGPWYRDADGDGFGDNNDTIEECLGGDGYVELSGDCDDNDALALPGAEERCNDADDDCDGEVDEEPTDAASWYTDADGDGYGDENEVTSACAAPTGTVAEPGDCDDNDGSAYPGANEVCGGGDENCNGVVDETTAVDAQTWYSDTDGDGYGASGGVTQCNAAGRVLLSGDCNELVASINPGATEVCNGADDDCDGDTDESDADDAVVWYLDGDADGYGVDSDSVVACDVPAGYADLSGDCDDADSASRPGALEVCGGGDEDCDGVTDEDDASDAGTWYADGDGDGYGDPDDITVACLAPHASQPTGEDCDDGDPDVSPAGTEACNSADDDCDGDTDEGEAVGAEAWFPDADGDGYGDPDGVVLACGAPTGYLSGADDCDDTREDVYPSAAEVCASGVDENCLGSDEDCRIDSEHLLTEADVIFLGANELEHAGSGLAAISGLDSVPGISLLIGSPGINSGSGTVWMVSPSGGATLSTTTARRINGTTSTGALDQRLGEVLTGPGDVNNDGDVDLALGVSKGNYNASDSGIAHLIFGPIPVATTTSAASLHYYGENTGAECGAALAGGSLDTDSRTELVVGAPGESTNGEDAGAVYVIDYAGTGWKNISTAPTRVDGEEGERFGAAIAVDDLDGDGSDDLAVGLPGATDSGTGGSVRLYLGSISGSLTNADADGTYSPGAEDAELGAALAAIQDHDGDGYAELWVGAPGSAEWSDAGGAAMLLGWDGDWVEIGVLGGDTDGYALGASVADAGDVDGDGFHDLLAGAGEARRAWLIYGPMDAAVEATDADTVFLDELDSAGSATVIGAGDTDGDGYDDIVIGAATATIGLLSQNGAAYLFYGAGD